ncbi:Site-specific DNA recombinase [Roseivivax halotolerans]|uniref:Site-specific DNA recombinase n=2 Tax=Roseivivax halotolerans TaxID=93684 RepID=A0A1I5ZJH7_9RHOB|nr:Site-specific DNA recombinase [Roseivivax halotolerans]
MRTSSATNVGGDKDSDKRQQKAIEAYADANGYQIVHTFYDAAVSGADPIDSRPGMQKLLDAVLSNGTRTILVESPDRFARDAVVQELGHRLLKDRGVDLIPTTAPDYFMVDTPTTELVRTILGAVAAFDRRNTVEKLKAARDRKSEALGRRVEGRKPISADALTEAKRLYRRNPKTGNRRSLRQIATELAKAGFTTPSGHEYQANSVRQMLVKAGVYQGQSA